MNAGRAATAALLLLALPATALAQSQACPSSPPAYRFLRFDEDHAYLRREACRVDFWDRSKLFALDDEAGQYVTVGGDARVRVETGRNLRYAPTPSDPSGDIVQRYHLHADARLGGDVRLFGEVKSNQVAGRRPGPIGTDVDRFDVHQAFVEVGGVVRAGRQEFMYGSGRRLFPRNGPNVRGSFDALRVMGRMGGWRIDGLIFQNVAIDPGKLDDTSQHDQRFWGLYATGPFSRPVNLDLYYLGADRDPARFAQGVAHEKRRTLGMRWFGAANGWDFDVEPAVQWGRFGPADIRAWSVAGEVGYILDAPRKPRAYVRVTGASGDRDPRAPDLQTFNSLFPRGGAAGEAWNFSAANLLHLRLALELTIAPRLTAAVGLDHIRRLSARDSVYGASGLPVAPAGSTDARVVGTDADVLLTWRASRQLLLALGAGYFRNGPYTRATTVAANQWFVFPYLIFQF